MFQVRNPRAASAPAQRRRGLTLVELLLSISIIAIVMGVLAGLARAVQMSSAHCAGHSLATQHARVALDRIARAVNGAYHVGDRAGVAVLKSTVDGATYPDMLVVWRPPASGPANGAGPPLVRELVVFCPHPNAPGQLIEVTAPNDNRSVPGNLDWNSASVRSMIDELIVSASVKRTLLTDLLHVVNTGTTTRGAVRFTTSAHPSDAELASYRSATTAWNDLPWPQGLYSSRSGSRRVNVRIELQLTPGYPSPLNPAMPIPFFGSATTVYTVFP